MLSIGVLSQVPALAKPITASLTGNSFSPRATDAIYIKRAAELADKSAGFSAPHPNFGCVIATGVNDGSGDGVGVVVGEGYLYAEGTKSAELQAVEAAGNNCRGATAYLNMEPGDCYNDRTAVSALVNVCFLAILLCHLFVLEFRFIYFWHVAWKIGKIVFCFLHFHLALYNVSI